MRPPGLRLSGAIEPRTHQVLERYLGELARRFPGRGVHLDLTAVTALDLAGAALVVATRDRLRHLGGDLQLHAAPGLLPSAHGRPGRPGRPVAGRGAPPVPRGLRAG
ncbi:STAS domain-containing protein [Streptomyces sp. NPDC003077]|uniref:STAS domain-containing protein n=1 Tax=Streptomyces sp. NPDC003077 TaxID=3154443 RepID=UPI0033BCB88C